MFSYKKGIPIQYQIKCNKKPAIYEYIDLWGQFMNKLNLQGKEIKVLVISNIFE
jgi:hypothetical protein